MNIPPRHELKYLISEEQAQQLSRALSPWCEPDKNSSRSTNGRYLVQSLYLDTPGRHLYWASKAEDHNRLKVRVRAYEAGPVFFEVKRKAKRLIRKSRAMVDREGWAQRLTGIMPAGANAFEQDFRAQIDRHLLEPAVLVRYQREAWVGIFDEYARVTIDRQVEYQLHDRLSLDANPNGWMPLDDPKSTLNVRRGVVLELKSSLAMPGWMHRLIASLGLWRLSYSKYCLAIERAQGRKNPLPVPPTIPTWSHEV